MACAATNIAAQCNAAINDLSIPQTTIPLGDDFQILMDLTSSVVATGTSNLEYFVVQVNPNNPNITEWPLVGITEWQYNGVTTQPGADFSALPTGNYALVPFAFNQFEVDAITFNPVAGGVIGAQGAESLNELASLFPNVTAFPVPNPLNIQIVLDVLSSATFVAIIGFSPCIAFNDNAIIPFAISKAVVSCPESLDIPTLPGDQTIYQVSDRISSDALHENAGMEIEFTAGECVNLTSGFEVTGSALFEANTYSTCGQDLEYYISITYRGNTRIFTDYELSHFNEPFSSFNGLSIRYGFNGYVLRNTLNFRNMDFNSPILALGFDVKTYFQPELNNILFSYFMDAEYDWSEGPQPSLNPPVNTNSIQITDFVEGVLLEGKIVGTSDSQSPYEIAFRLPFP